MSYQTLKAEVDTEGHVRLLEPLALKHKAQAMVTILEDTPEISHNILRLAGLIPVADLERMEKAIEESCERIDTND